MKVIKLIVRQIKVSKLRVELNIVNNY